AGGCGLSGLVAPTALVAATAAPAVVEGDHDVHEVAGDDEAGHAADAVDADGDGDVVVGDAPGRGDLAVDRVHEHALDEHLAPGEVGDGRLAHDRVERLRRDRGGRVELLGDLGGLEQVELDGVGTEGAAHDVLPDPDDAHP